MSGPNACGQSVYWWDGEYEGNCERPEGHDGPHFDGMSWYNDDNEEVAEPDIAPFLRARLDEAAEDYRTGPWPKWDIKPSEMSARIKQGLADIDAKRRIVDWALDEDDENGPVRAERTIESEWGTGPDLSDRLLRLLASAYAGHPSYWDGWRP